MPAAKKKKKEKQTNGRTTQLGHLIDLAARSQQTILN